jgi:hypothetical protein
MGGCAWGGPAGFAIVGFLEGMEEASGPYFFPFWVSVRDIVFRSSSRSASCGTD